MAKFIEIRENYINVEHIVRVKKEKNHSSYVGDYTTYELFLTNSYASMIINEEEYNRIVSML